MLRFVINTLFIVLSLLYISSDAKHKLLADVYTLVLMLPLYFFIALKYFGFTFDFKILKQGLLFSIPFIPTLMVAWVLGFSNRYFIDIYMGLTSVGLFSMAYKIASIIGILLGSIGVAFSPFFYRFAKKEGVGSVSLRTLSEKIIGSMIVSTFIITIFIPEVVNWVLDEKYHEIRL